MEIPKHHTSVVELNYLWIRRAEYLFYQGLKTRLSAIKLVCQLTDKIFFKERQKKKNPKLTNVTITMPDTQSKIRLRSRKNRPPNQEKKLLNKENISFMKSEVKTIENRTQATSRSYFTLDLTQIN